MENKPRFITVITGVRGYAFVNPNYIVNIMPFRGRSKTTYYVHFQSETNKLATGMISEEDYMWLVGINDEALKRKLEEENDSKRNTDDSRE